MKEMTITLRKQYSRFEFFYWNTSNVRIDDDVPGVGTMGQAVDYILALYPGATIYVEAT